MDSQGKKMLMVKMFGFCCAMQCQTIGLKVAEKMRRVVIPVSLPGVSRRDLMIPTHEEMKSKKLILRSS